MKYRDEYLDILKQELKKAMGCTEPIAISYLSCYLKDLLGDIPERVEIFVSGNILKNVKSVVVPNTNGLRGIKAACSIGVVAGKKELVLECISKVTNEDIKKCKEFLQRNNIKVNYSNDNYIFDIHIFMYKENDVVEGRIVNDHTNIVYLRKNNNVIMNKDLSMYKGIHNSKIYDLLSVKEIYDFANEIDINDVKDVIDEQIKCNMAIAEVGLKENYGANIGKTLLKEYPNDISIKARAYASSASDARMNGCDMPVVINSGSGNQGITCSVPVIVFAKELNVSHEKLIRTLVLSNLLTIHIKKGIGRLSAFCGVVAAGCAVGGAIAYLYTENVDVVAHTIVNSLAIISGIICDGAKASCAGKISSSIEAGILGFKLYQNGNEFYSGDGIVSKGVDNTINNIGIIASKGMIETDKEIINIMLNQ